MPLFFRRQNTHISVSAFVYVHGLQIPDLPASSFQRRLTPARGTCEWATRRQDALSQRVSRMSNLLRTRVEIEQQQSSQALASHHEPQTRPATPAAVHRRGPVSRPHHLTILSAWCPTWPRACKKLAGPTARKAAPLWLLSALSLSLSWACGGFCADCTGKSRRDRLKVRERKGQRGWTSLTVCVIGCSKTAYCMHVTCAQGIWAGLNWHYIPFNHEVQKPINSIKTRA